MKKLTPLQGFLIVVGLIAIIYVIANWNKIFGTNNASTTRTSNGAAGRRNLSVGESMAIDKFKRDLSSLRVQSERDVLPKESQIRQAVANINQSFRNIGSNARAEFLGTDPLQRTKCSDVALNRDCTGYAGILFGTVCITWGCAAK